MKFSEADLQSYALPLGEAAKEQSLAVLAEILQCLKSLGWKIEKSTGQDKLVDYKVELTHPSQGRLLLLPLGGYGNDTRGDKREPLEIGVITSCPATELGPQLSFKLMGGYAELEAGLGAIFIDIGPAKATIVRIGYRVEAGTVLAYNNQKIFINPEFERSLGAMMHKATNYSYKKLVRIVKKLHSMMCEADCLVAQQVEAYGLERLLLALEVEDLRHFDRLGEKLKYCTLKLSRLLEQKPEQLFKGEKMAWSITEGELAVYQKFLVELRSFCELE